MNIRKFIAPTTRQALKDIRIQLGEDAIILSNRAIPEGVEILATLDEDMSEVVAAPAATVQPAAPVVKPVLGAEINSNVLDEIRAMQQQLQQQLASLSMPIAPVGSSNRSKLMSQMLASGFSANLSRQLFSRLPADQGTDWLKRTLKRNLQLAATQDQLVDQGGVYALIGPTGVGKTTTTAKLAARAVVRYGADKVALLTTDSYRIGAYEQLKIYGKILGVAVHAIRDVNDLKLTLNSLKDKHLVLIDTVGMGQRDERVAVQREMFHACDVQCLLLLNATSSGDTLDDVIYAYKQTGGNVIGGILTKLDESVSPAACIDNLIRHQLPLFYMTNGQRVPEDIHLPNLDYLLHEAFKSRAEKHAYTLHEDEIDELFATQDFMHPQRSDSLMEV